MLLQRSGKARGGRPKKDGTPAKHRNKEVSKKVVPANQRKIAKLLAKGNLPENKEALSKLGIRRYSLKEIKEYLKK